MASSMKHRKGTHSNGSPHPRHVGDSDSSSCTSSRQNTSIKHDGSANSKAIAPAALLAVLIIVPVCWLLRSSSSTSPPSSAQDVFQSQLMPASMGRPNTGLRSANANNSPTPLSTLLNGGAKTNAEMPLTGVYTLGKDHLLQKNKNPDDQITVTGIIQFPHEDLSSVLKEEAMQQSLMFGNFGQRIIREDNDKNSFLSDDFNFQSALGIDGKDLVHPLVEEQDQAVLTRCGYKMGKVPNQDRSIIAHFFIDADSSGGQPELHKKRALLMGIFDGHGPRGHAVSHHIALELPRIFAETLREKQSSLSQPLLDVDNIQKSLIETFLKVDETEPVKGSAGSTASTLFYPGIGPKVYIANAGDSTTLIATYSKSSKKSTILFVNRKHKPHLIEEQQRIKKAGGQVMIPPSVLMQDNSDGLKETSRVIIPDPNGNPFGGLALAMSRSIGDFDGRSIGLIAEPDVLLWDVNEYYDNNQFSQEQKDDTMWFAVVASDGVYDLLPPHIVADYLGERLFHDPKPLEACERIIREASRLWMEASGGGMPYRDDISIGVSKINFDSI